MKWSRAKSVLWRTAPGYLALMTPDGAPSEIHGPGAEVWSLLEQSVETETLVDAIASRYSADRDVVAGDVRRLLEQLHTDGYVDRIE